MAFKSSIPTIFLPSSVGVALRRSHSVGTPSGTPSGHSVGTPSGDRNGVSFYSYERICEILGITLDDYLVRRNRLIDKDLIDFEGTRFQVLSLPARPVAASASARSDREGIERADPASSR